MKPGAKVLITGGSRKGERGEVVCEGVAKFGVHRTWCVRIAGDVRVAQIREDFLEAVPG